MKRLISVLVLALLLVGAASPAYAQGNGRAGLVAFGRDVVVQANEVVTGDVVVFGGNAVVEAKAHVIGNVIAFGGDVRSAGEVDLSVVAFGGDVDLQAGSQVHQDVVTVGGSLRQAAGARIDGTVSSGFMFNLGNGSTSTRPLPLQPLTPVFGRPWAGDLALSIIMGFVLGVVKIVVLAALAVVLVAVFPRQIAGVKQTVTAQPGASAGVGCLTYLAAIALTIPLIITCIGNFLMWPLLVIATTFGLGALGLIVGERITGAQGANPRSPAFNAALGTGLICLVLLVLDAIPLVGCFSWVFWMLVASLATGAVVLSKFGTQVPPMAPAPSLAPTGGPSAAAATPTAVMLAPALAAPLEAPPVAPSIEPTGPAGESGDQPGQ
jgi:hypothetical protein